jgi:branched-chain amino acid transport system ATP-binding protein
MRSPAKLLVQNLKIQRGGRQVLHDVSIEVSAGEVVALLGANGAGKSSLVMATAGVLPISSGSVKLGDTKLNKLPPDAVRRAGLAVVPEGHRVLGTLTVRENLAAAALGYNARDAEMYVQQALQLFPELNRHLAQLASSLSGGQKQMVSISQALIAKPKILVVDELSLGLSPAVITRLIEAIEIIARQGSGILLVEQFTTLALRIAQRAYVLSLGYVAFEGGASTLLSQPGVLHRAYLRGASAH